MNKVVYSDAYQRDFTRILPDLIRSREVLWDLIWKDFRIRYRYALMGFLWAILEPLMLCLILTFVFSFVFQLRNLDPTIESRWDFAALLLCALIPWQFFSHGVNTSANSLVDHRDLVGKIYFPREIVPLSTVGIAAVNFFFSFLVLLVLLAAFGRPPGAAAGWALVLILIQGALICGLSLFLAAANVKFRDIKYMLDVALVFAFYATPIFYTIRTVKTAVDTRLDETWSWLYYVYFVNPMVGLVTSYRDVLVYNRRPDWELLAWPALFAAASLAFGAYFFRRRAGLLSDYL